MGVDERSPIKLATKADVEAAWRGCQSTIRKWIGALEIVRDPNQVYGGRFLQIDGSPKNFYIKYSRYTGKTAGNSDTGFYAEETIEGRASFSIGPRIQTADGTRGAHYLITVSSGEDEDSREREQYLCHGRKNAKKALVKLAQRYIKSSKIDVKVALITNPSLDCLVKKC